jgi:hypothetical protein
LVIIAVIFPFDYPILFFSLSTSLFVYPFVRALFLPRIRRLVHVHFPARRHFTQIETNYHPSSLGPNQNNPYGPLTTTWRSEEKRYLLSILNRVTLSPVSYFEDDIITETSDKVRVLIQSLLDEKEEVEILLSSRSTIDDSESRDEIAGYSGIIFVQRRDAVIALAEVLRHHPATKDQFRIGTLLGNSENSYRHSMMDITRSPAFVSPNLVSTAADESSSDSDPSANSTANEPDSTAQEDDDS